MTIQFCQAQREVQQLLQIQQLVIFPIDLLETALREPIKLQTAILTRETRLVYGLVVFCHWFALCYIGAMIVSWYASSMLIQIYSLWYLSWTKIYFFHTMKVIGVQCCLDPNFPQNVLCVWQKKVSHRSLEQHELYAYISIKTVQMEVL